MGWMFLEQPDRSIMDVELARASRLLVFLKGEVSSMPGAARLKFTEDLFHYLTPELVELVRQGKLPVSLEKMKDMAVPLPQEP